MTLLSLHMLGAFDVRFNGQSLRGFRSVKNEALLAHLALTAGRPHTRAALAGLLWPDQPENAARRNLRQALFQLRTVLDAAATVLIADQNVVRLDDANVWVDAAVFTQLYDACRRHNHVALQSCPACMARYEEAVELYRGEFLHGLFIDDSQPLEEWVLLQREWFHARCMEMLDALAAWREANGDYSAAHRYAQRQIELDPLREEAYRRAMRALALAGQRGAALAAYESCWRLLEEELGASPSVETETLAAQIRAGALPGAAEALPVTIHGVAPRLHNLPPPSTTFIGRETEQTRLRQWLLDPVRRLITIVGPGGAGKTRLALAAAQDISGAFADGVWFIPLVGVDNLDALVSAIGRELGISFQAAPDPWQQLVAFLAAREVLLILDNFEHLLALTARIDELLSRSPRLKLLVTSRTRLNFQAEHIMPLHGLPLSDPDVGIAALERFGGAQLFLDRARSVDPGFTVDEANARAIADICRAVEGLPLAIELAASWVESYTCEEIVAAIHSNLDFLATTKQDVPARQRSVRAVFDYSWRLLTQDEQRVLAQLSVFRGEFGREAALAVTLASVEAIMGLVRQSLLRVVRPGRFVMHELLRQFASEQAAQLALHDPALQIAVARLRHAHYFLKLLADQTALLVGKEPQRSMALLNAEVENLHAAWQWAIKHGATVELAQALEGAARFHELAGLHREAVQLFNDALAIIADEPARAALQIEIARACIILARYDDAMAAGRAALESAQQRNDDEQTAAALLQLGIVANAMGDAVASEKHLLAALPLAQHAEAEALIAEILAAQAAARTYLGGNGGDLLHQALAIYRSLGNRRREGLTLSDLAMIATRAPDWDACARYATAALEIARDLGERRFESMTLNILAAAHAERGDLAESDRALHRSAHLARAIGYQLGEVNALNSLGLNHLHRQERAVARDYFEQALAIARRTNYRRGVGALLSNLGVIAAQDEEYARAEQLQREALEIARAAEDHYFTVVRLDSLGDVLRWQGDYAGAFACFVEAAELAARIGNAGLEAHARTDVGLLAQFFGDARCERELNRGLLLARQVQDIGCECRAAAALAAQRLATHNDPAALAELEAIATRARAANETAAEAHAQTALGAALLEQGVYAAAATALDRALTLRRDLPGASMRLTPLALLANLHRRRNDLPAALRTVEEILHILDDGANGYHNIGGVDDPMAVYIACVEALGVAGDERAQVILQRGRQHLLAQANAFPSPMLRARVEGWQQTTPEAH